MSRVGNNPITIPEGVSVEISDNKVVVKGKLGEIEQEFSDVVVKMNDGVVNIERTSDSVMDALVDLTILSKTNIMINSPSSFLKTALLLRKING